MAINKLNPMVNNTLLKFTLAIAIFLCSAQVRAQYCIPESLIDCVQGFDEYISNVTVNGVSNASGCSPYTNYSASIQFSGAVGQSIPFSVSVTNFFPSDDIAIFIDWNNDTDFTDADELVFQSGFSGANSVNPQTGTFTVPVSASPGLYRMRIRLSYAQSVPNPCALFGLGETEDYTFELNAQSDCVNNPPTISVNSPTICSGNTATLTASGADTYTWSPTNGLSASTGSSVSANPTITTTYIVTGTVTATGCTNTANAVVTVTPLNTIAAGQNRTVCLNAAITPITLTTTGATGATFSGLPAGVSGSFASNTVTISGSPTSPGTFSYTVTTTGGCPPATASGTITVNTLNTIAAGQNRTLCVDETMTAIILATTGATGATFSGLPAGVSGSFASNTVTINGVPTTSGTFSYTVTTTGGCPPATATGTITVNTLPVVSAGSDITVCNVPEPTTLTGFSPSGGSWTGTGVTSGGIFTPTAPGSFTLTYTVTNANNCSADASIIVTVTDQVSVNAGNDFSICENASSVNLNTLNPSPSGGTWNGPGVNGNLFNPAGLTGTQAITYTVGSGSCTSSDVIEIQIIQGSQLEVTTQVTQPTSCGLSNGILSSVVTGGNSPFSYAWSNGTTSAQLTGVGNYSVTVTDQAGCTAIGSGSLEGSICTKVPSQSISNIGQNNATVSWPAVSCANKYSIQIKQVGTATQTIFIVDAPLTSYTFTGLNPGITYQVRIRTQCSENDDVLSQYSPITSFTTLNSQGLQCAPPSGISAGDISATSATISWDTIPAAVQYNLRYRTLGSSNWTTVLVNDSLNSQTLQSLNPASIYELQLRTKCNNNPKEFSTYSGIITFSTPPLRLSEAESTFNTLLYPNPVKNNLSLIINSVTDERVSITLSDIQGRVLITDVEQLIQGTSTINYSLTDYAPGIYIIHISSASKSQLIKFIKE